MKLLKWTLGHIGEWRIRYKIDETEEVANGLAMSLSRKHRLTPRKLLIQGEKPKSRLRKRCCRCGCEGDARSLRMEVL